MSEIYNKLTIVGTDEQIKEVIEFIRSTTGKDDEPMHIDFNTIIEMPSSLNIEFTYESDVARQFLYEDSFYQQGASRLEAWRMFQTVEGDKEKHIEFAIQIQENLQKTGHAFGHDWKQTYWGMKENASSQTLEAPNVITFQTKGAPASKVIAELASIFNDVKFMHQYTVEKDYAYSLPF